MTLQQEYCIQRYHENKRLEEAARKETAAQRRKRLDHERYLRHREERHAKQRDYYAANRKKILEGKRLAGMLKYGTLRKMMPTVVAEHSCSLPY